MIQKPKFQVIIDSDKCKGCKLCVDVCPKGVLSMTENCNPNNYNYPVADSEKCIGCLFCVRMCPDICFEIKEQNERLI